MDVFATRPLIGISCCVKQFRGVSNQAASASYIDWVADGCAGIPVLLPALDIGSGIEGLLARLDGIVLTGSRSNVEPHHYGAEAHAECEPHDPARDSMTLPLIRAAIARGLPLLAICRGFQELNVALGGTLHRRIQDLPGRFDHSSPSEQAMPVRIALAHHVDLEPGGYLAQLLGAGSIPVNSLHKQGIDRPAERLVIEGRAPDGTIEAGRVADAPGFALGVQWHPERRALDDPNAARLFAAFGAAARKYAAARENAPPATAP